MSDFGRRIAVWDHTRELLRRVGERLPRPSWQKLTRTDDVDYANVVNADVFPHVWVENEDCLVTAERLGRRERTRPVVLVLADHRFAGGDVDRGSGAQEESLFRRTNLSCVLRNEAVGLYPILPHQAVLCRDVTVLKGPERDGALPLAQPFLADFVACPGLHNPELTDDGKNLLRSEDERMLRVKVRLILDAARMADPSRPRKVLVLGPLGCGAWRNPPEVVARVMRDEIRAHGAGISSIAISCLEVDPRAYIVQNRGRPSNYAVFRNVFEREARNCESMPPFVL